MRTYRSRLSGVKVVSQPDNLEIAIIGWSCRIVESSRFDALPRRPGEQAPAPATTTLWAPTELDYFDAPFFGFSSQETSTMEGDRCVLLELAHEALEKAGYDPSRHAARIGVFAGFGEPLRPTRRPLGSGHHGRCQTSNNLGYLGATGALGIEAF
jgi:hypothetical protein